MQPIWYEREDSHLQNSIFSANISAEATLYQKCETRTPGVHRADLGIQVSGQ